MARSDRRARRLAAREAASLKKKQAAVQAVDPARQVATTEASGRTLNTDAVARFAVAGDHDKVKQVMDVLTAKMAEAGIKEDPALALPLPEVKEAPAINVRGLLYLAEHYEPANDAAIQTVVATLRQRLG